MTTAISEKNRLYLKQVELQKIYNPCEILPLNFNYQDLVIVVTNIVKDIVFQTHSCGCGPQPSIKGGFLEKTIPWGATRMKALLAVSSHNKEEALASLKMVDFVYMVRKACSAEEKGLIARVLQDHFGPGKKVGFF